jgi:hypothetical protein
MDAKTRELVRRRANNRCEFCHLPQAGHEVRFSVDHVIPIKHGGEDSNANLALAYLRCNLCKGPNLSGIDPIGGQIISLYNPRIQKWSDHYRWNGGVIVGLTPEGRATLSVLLMNVPERVQLRQVLVAEGLMKLD